MPLFHLLPPMLSAVKVEQCLDTRGLQSFQPDMLGKIILELNLYYVPLFRIWPENSPRDWLWKLIGDSCNHPIFSSDYLNQECHFIVTKSPF